MSSGTNNLLYSFCKGKLATSRIQDTNALSSLPTPPQHLPPPAAHTLTSIPHMQWSLLWVSQRMTQLVGNTERSDLSCGPYFPNAMIHTGSKHRAGDVGLDSDLT